jgi:hypothetical protein
MDWLLTPLRAKKHRAPAGVNDAFRQIMYNHDRLTRNPPSATLIDVQAAHKNADIGG